MGDIVFYIVGGLIVLLGDFVLGYLFAAREFGKDIKRLNDSLSYWRREWFALNKKYKEARLMYKEATTDEYSE